MAIRHVALLLTLSVAAIAGFSETSTAGQAIFQGPPGGFRLTVPVCRPLGRALGDKAARREIPEGRPLPGLRSSVAGSSLLIRDVRSAVRACK